MKNCSGSSHHKVPPIVQGKAQNTTTLGRGIYWVRPALAEVALLPALEAFRKGGDTTKEKKGGLQDEKLNQDSRKMNHVTEEVPSLQGTRKDFIINFSPGFLAFVHWGQGSPVLRQKEKKKSPSSGNIKHKLICVQYYIQTLVILTPRNNKPHPEHVDFTKSFQSCLYLKYLYIGFIFLHTNPANMGLVCVGWYFRYKAKKNKAGKSKVTQHIWI